MLNRAERRRRNKVIYNRRAKLFMRLGWDHVPCDKEEIPEHRLPYKINRRFWRRAETYKELQEKSPIMHLYKNTKTIWDHGYWDKYDRHRLNKQSRRNAKLDLLNDNDIIFERTNIK